MNYLASHYIKSNTKSNNKSNDMKKLNTAESYRNEPNQLVTKRTNYESNISN